MGGEFEVQAGRSENIRRDFASSSETAPDIASLSDSHSSHIQMLRNDVEKLESVGFLKKSQPVLAILGIGALSLATLGLPVLCAVMFFAGRYTRHSIESDGFIDTPFKDTVKEMKDIGRTILGTSEARELAKEVKRDRSIDLSKKELKELRKIYRNYENTPELQLIVKKFAIMHSKILNDNQKMELIKKYGNNLDNLKKEYDMIVLRHSRLDDSSKIIEALLKEDDSKVGLAYDNLMIEIEKIKKMRGQLKPGADIEKFQGRENNEEKRAAIDEMKNNLANLFDDVMLNNIYLIVFNILKNK